MMPNLNKIIFPQTLLFFFPQTFFWARICQELPQEVLFVHCEEHRGYLCLLSPPPSFPPSLSFLIFISKHFQMTVDHCIVQTWNLARCDDFCFVTGYSHSNHHASKTACFRCREPQQFSHSEIHLGIQKRKKKKKTLCLFSNFSNSANSASSHS